ncbi:hypothetical protein PsorP6_015061 [Peronosclerospora sorghi]|uniref:Uncharacterized protein n=1 Tax=Peronosclerospora sorghi TaxID=230839 RepID=A0ACC0VSJ6_9STRA|nr:hypothetical protein PsorP6_015061 [Peronosclerospora sorghi]
MKLGADDTKQYGLVKECFEGSEAKRYPEIQTCVVILAVNKQEVGGLGLSRSSAVPNGIKKKTTPQQNHSLEKSSGSDKMDDIGGIAKDETSAPRLEAQQFKKN